MRLGVEASRVRIAERLGFEDADVPLASVSELRGDFTGTFRYFEVLLDTLKYLGNLGTFCHLHLCQSSVGREMTN